MFLALGVQFPAWDIVSGFALRVYLRAKGDAVGIRSCRGNGAEPSNGADYRRTGMCGAVGTIFSKPSWRANPGAGCTSEGWKFAGAVAGSRSGGIQLGGVRNFLEHAAAGIRGSGAYLG